MSSNENRAAKAMLQAPDGSERLPTWAEAYETFHIDGITRPARRLAEPAQPAR